jgi:archaellum component FlaG (FlaF/FlaG flagellin family)
MNYKKIYFFIIISIVLLQSNTIQAQIRNNVTYDGQGRPMSNFRNKADTTFKRRDVNEDSLTIFYTPFNGLGINKLDTTINNFYNYFPLPSSYNHLGNFGTAARNLIFSTTNTTGFSSGFNSFDIYNYSLQNTKLYNTTRAFTELAYMLGSGAEQMINVLHTQNKKDNVNFSLEYRFINSPGDYQSQNANHNNLRFTYQYQSPNKRYKAVVVLMSNKNQSSENGGLQNPKRLDSLTIGNPYEFTTRMGPGDLARRSLFSTVINTGNIQTNSNIVLRHSYDFGQKDSIVTDSAVYKLFYPRLRIQHEIQVQSQTASFIDPYADSANYRKFFGYVLNKSKDNLRFKDAFSNIQNEFSLISYPDKKNSNQYAKTSITLQNFKGTFSDTATTKNTSFYNVIVGGEYRNKTKNGVWDIDAVAQLYLSGFNSGDYLAKISLEKQLGKKGGNLQIGFQNINKSVSFIYNNLSSFRITNRGNTSKENSTRIWAQYINQKLGVQLAANYYLVSNFMYADSFFKLKQDASLINVLHLSGEKMFKLKKNINAYANLDIQQSTANAPINIPLALARLRIAFEGNFYKNLFLSTGVEVRYTTNFKAAGYSPFINQFLYNDTYTISNRPDVHLFFNFKIKRFKAFVRVENLNTLIPPTGFKSYNFVADNYPSQTLWLRLGIWWKFIN